jgi:hypothetical protein
MKNTLEDLNNHLFAQLERLSDEDLSDQALTTEIQRANAISNVAVQIVSNGQLALKVQRALGNHEIQSAPKYLEGRS